MREEPLGAPGSDSPGRSRPAVRALLWGLLFYAAGQVGVHTSLPGVPLALVAPSAGVLLVWFSFSDRRTLPYDVAVLAVAGMLLAHSLGLPWPLVLLNPVISVSQALVFVTVLRRLTGDLAPLGGDRERWRMSDLGGFFVAAVASAFTVAVLATLSQGAAGLPTGDLATFLTRWGRSSASVVAVAALGLIIGPSLRTAVRERTLGAWLRERLLTDHARRVEMGALLVTALALNVGSFYWLEHLPLTFAMFVTTAWVGIRCTPGVAAAYSLAGGTFAVVATLRGHGIFAVAIEDPAQRAVVAQLFVLVTAATCLSLAVARSQMLAAETLAESRLQMLDQVLSEVNDGIMLVQDDGRVLVVNQAGKDLFDVDGDLDVLRPAESFEVYEADGSRVTEERAPFRRALDGERVNGEDFEVRGPDGTVRRYLRLNAEVLPALGPEVPPRVLMSYHDITGDRLRQDALATFAGHVAHDLRNPLSVVEAWNEVLADTATSGEELTPEVVLPMTGRIGAASARMRDFLQGLLDYTLARDRRLKPEPVDLVAIARDVAALRTGGTDEAAPAHISVLGAGTALADPELVRIVLDNLVANACKYVAPGVRPRVLVLVEELDPVTVEVCVLDNGIGIPADQREKVFEPFHRIEEGGRFQGTGLGLGICQRIVQRHGGTISVDEVAQGASLRVTLPRAVAAVEDLPPDLPPDLPRDLPPDPERPLVLG